ncbi:hypothetical protein A2U01_0043025 [Trifolium medium]|uniref:Uncharacterized protein n=1 Tax=Trifolium medium TaxID=97028 RepID=A0A392QCH6_9FABA|nr:hypothetical protein [Trifolium medium]
MFKWGLGGGSPAQIEPPACLHPHGSPVVSLHHYPPHLTSQPAMAQDPKARRPQSQARTQVGADVDVGALADARPPILS